MNEGSNNNFTYPNDIDSNNNSEFLNLQDNYSNFYKILNKDQKTIDFVFPCLSLGFLENYDKYKEYEYSKKIIAPKSLLYQLSEYEITFPIFLNINNNNTIFGVIEFVDYIEHIYIPYDEFEKLNLIENQSININILINSKKIPLAETLYLKPLDKSFFKINDIKEYLETNLKKIFSVR